MHNAAEAYSETAKVTTPPRELEASLLIKAARQLQCAKDGWTQKTNTADEALLYNRRLWTIFLTSISREDNPLPTEIKNNVASLAAFVFQQTLMAQRSPEPDMLEPLIVINREVASGLCNRS